MAVIAEVKKLSITSQDLQTLVSDISFSLHTGKTFCLIGESGSGKTLTLKAMLGMLPNQLHLTGELLFNGTNTVPFTRREWQRIRGKQIGIIFQHPEQALHPAIPIGRQLVDLLRSHISITKLEAERQACRMLDKVGLKPADILMKRYPHQLSGGMNQRVMIAMALLLGPELLIADEPTSALDVTTQADILTLLRGLTAESEMSLLLVTHDLLIANYIADTIAVMVQGTIIEQGNAQDVIKHPRQEYTRILWEYRSKFMIT
ncbi:ABC transporter ATP-binding protein [Paenibacillus sp. WQ 127069]|uniref:ABC transporter ATP-binding protein n=1 Tax=Paenibacillus baimaensis TaxID=2982185 RepID=A0ABT2U974_9BACL|nr:ABC transporter ATP-binding protein [Paenibacillus sp. WQ 127069]MCU6791189.1 ABC transporter ATP-binding protein [Paenibacillus sp. WQ 127069]